MKNPLPSFWYKAVSNIKRFPYLEGEVFVDICIIGAGIAGSSAAYHLSKTGLKTALLEKNNICSGDSGYSTAFITHFIDTIKDTVPSWSATDKGVDLIKEAIASEGIECDFKELPCVYFSKQQNTKEFYKTLSLYKKADPKLKTFSKIESKKMVGFETTAGFVKEKGEFDFHPRKYILGLLSAASKKYGLKVFEQSEVISVVRENDKIFVKTEKAQVVCNKLIVAMGYPYLFEEVAKKLKVASTFVIQANITNKKPFLDATYFDDLAPFHYFRYANGSLLLGGEDHFIKQTKNISDPYAELEKFLKTLTKEKFKVENKWQGAEFYTEKGLPFFGNHKEYGKNIIFLCGFGGDGMAHGSLFGWLAKEKVLGKPNKFYQLFSFDRK